MTSIDRIDPAPDPELGLALRDLLDDPTRDRVLLARLQLAIRTTPQATGIDILAAWARPGLAAAALLCAGLGLWLTMQSAAVPATSEMAMAPSGESMIAAAVGTR